MRKNIYKEFRALLNFGVKFDWLRTNPLIKVENFKDAYETKETIAYYTSGEFIKFIDAGSTQAKSNFYEWNYVVFFSIAFYTGLRKGEIYALKWSDLEGDRFARPMQYKPKNEG